MAIALQVGWHGPKTGAEAPRFPAGRKRPWSEDSEKMLQLMMGQFGRRTETLDLLGGSSTAAHMMLELESEKPLPCGWEKCLDLKTGSVYYVNSSSDKKTLLDPHELFQSCSMATQLSTGESFSPSDCTKMELSRRCASFLPSELVEQMSEKTFTRVVTTPKSEDSLLELAGNLAQRQEAKLLYGLERNEENEFPAPAKVERIADSSLELKLNLEPTLIPAKEEKETVLNPLTGFPSGHFQRKSIPDIKAIQPSTPSFGQSDASRPLNCLLESRTSLGTASTPSSSVHSFWSLQTLADHGSTVQSREGGGSRSSSSEAESEKMERGGDQTLAIVGCPNCLMYVMLCKMDPRCPKCGSSVLLDFPNDSSSSSKRPRLA